MVHLGRAYLLGKALWDQLPPRERRDWGPMSEHDEIPEGDYQALKKLYPREAAALAPSDKQSQEVWRDIEDAYRQGYNDARKESHMPRRNPPLREETAAADALEALVDNWGIAGVLGMLSDVCMEKHFHIIQNWQDRTGARPWKQVAEKLYRMSQDTALPT